MEHSARCWQRTRHNTQTSKRYLSCALNCFQLNKPTAAHIQREDGIEVSKQISHELWIQLINWRIEVTRIETRCLMRQLLIFSLKLRLSAIQREWKKNVMRCCVFVCIPLSSFALISLSQQSAHMVRIAVAWCALMTVKYKHKQQLQNFFIIFIHQSCSKMSFKCSRLPRFGFKKLELTKMNIYGFSILPNETMRFNR